MLLNYVIKLLLKNFYYIFVKQIKIEFLFPYHQITEMFKNIQLEYVYPVCLLGTFRFGANNDLMI